MNSGYLTEKQRLLISKWRNDLYFYRNVLSEVDRVMLWGVSPHESIEVDSETRMKLNIIRQKWISHLDELKKQRIIQLNQLLGT